MKNNKLILASFTSALIMTVPVMSADKDMKDVAPNSRKIATVPAAAPAASTSGASAGAAASNPSPAGWATTPAPEYKNPTMEEPVFAIIRTALLTPVSETTDKSLQEKYDGFLTDISHYGQMLEMSGNKTNKTLAFLRRIYQRIDELRAIGSKMPQERECEGKRSLESAAALAKK